MRFTRPATLAFCASLVFGQSVAADVISDWNVIAQANIGPARPVSLFGATGPAGQIDLALMHLAMHDAVQAVRPALRNLLCSRSGHDTATMTGMR